MNPYGMVRACVLAEGLRAVSWFESPVIVTDEEYVIFYPIQILSLSEKDDDDSHHLVEVLVWHGTFHSFNNKNKIITTTTYYLMTS